MIMFRVGCGLRVSMGLVRRVVWLRLGWGWVVLGLGSVILRLRGIIWFRLGRIVRFWSWFGMWLIILGLGFRVGWRWTAITWNLPRLGTSTRHQVHAIIHLIQIRVLTADIISFVPVGFTRTRFPAFR